jgi:hypothetical protein
MSSSQDVGILPQILGHKLGGGIAASLSFVFNPQSCGNSSESCLQIEDSYENEKMVLIGRRPRVGAVLFHGLNFV